MKTTKEIRHFCKDGLYEGKEFLTASRRGIPKNTIPYGAFFIIMCVLFIPATVMALAPCNPNATAATRQILSFISNLSSRSDNKVISGQQCGDAGAGIPGYVTYVENLHTQTGKWVAMIGADYCYPGYPNANTIASIDTMLLRYWNAGGLIEITAHIGNPWGGDVRNTTVGNFNDLLTPGNAAYDLWMKDLGMVADGLAFLRDKGVAVLWRPLHEMNGGWFWWHTDTTTYKKLWVFMYNYFTNTRNLNNLLWVFAPNAGSNTSVYFPGSNYCDIVGLDYYGSSFSIGGYSEMCALGKPFGLTELCFNVNGGDGSYDQIGYINGIRSKVPQTCFFLVWSSWPGAKLAIVDNANASGLLNDPWVITRDELSWKTSAIPMPTSYYRQGSAAQHIEMPLYSILGRKISETTVADCKDGKPAKTMGAGILVSPGENKNITNKIIILGR